MNDAQKSGQIQRYTAGQRSNHWFIAIAFVLLALSGLALFHPAFYWLSNLFGGGPWTRILHPYIGVVMFVFFIVLALRLWRHNLLTRQDRQWLGQFGDVINNREDKLPEQGRYNGGQKIMYFAMLILMIGLLVTGIVIWRAWFQGSFSVELIRLGSLLHAVFAFLLICAIIVHVYAAIWIKGTVRAMTRGTVSQGWAWKHHRAWFRQMRKSAAPK